MPILDGEQGFEGCQGVCRDDVQRAQFWNCMLNGGVRTFLRGRRHLEHEHAVKSPTARARTARAGVTRPGTSPCTGRDRDRSVRQELLERLQWVAMEPHPEWVGNYDPKQAIIPWVAGVSGEFRVYDFLRPLNSGYRFTCRFLEEVR